LNDEQIASVVTYVLRKFGGAKILVKPTEVGKWRKQFNEQQMPYRRKDLEQMIQSLHAPRLLSDLKYSIYSGKWKQLPDFSKLDPAKTGKLKNNLITLEPAKGIKKPFGMVFEASMTIPKTGTYEFSLSSDDGSALAVDGEGVIDNDGIHPAKIVRAREKLEAGNHHLKVLYFEGGGNRSLSLAVQTERFGRLTLSKEKLNKKGKKKTFDPILLTPENPGEAVVERAFLPDSKPRAIGVGYPDHVNLCWDADIMNLAYVWRGEFMDASPNWNGRGSGSKPLGQDRVATAHGLPFQVLESLDEPWQPFSEAKIKYERDNPDPHREITFNIHPPGYRFLGYRLDKKRFPTFLYQYDDLHVSDFYTPRKVDGIPSIVRTLKARGSASPNTYLRVADSGPLTERDGWYDVGGKMKIKITGAEPVVRQINGHRELLVMIPGDTDLEITYRWQSPLPTSQ